MHNFPATHDDDDDDNSAKGGADRHSSQHRAKER